MVVFLICKNEEEKDPIKTKGAGVVTTLYINFSDAKGQITPELVLVPGGKTFMHVLVTCGNEDDSIKDEEARVVTTFSHCKSMGTFFRRSMAANSAVPGRIWPNFELIRNLMTVLVT